MTRIAFIGLGNMGGGMAIRQVVGGREVHAFDLSEAAVKKVVSAGAYEAGSIAKAVEGADVVITMLPAGPHVRKVYDEHILPHAPKSALLIDCSTIDVDSARAVGAQAKAAGFRFADAPVSGGIGGAVHVVPAILLPPRDWLHERINHRFGEMIDAGAVDEVRALLDLGLPVSAPVMKAIGVPEIARYLAGHRDDSWWHRLMDGGGAARAAVLWRLARMAQAAGVFFNLGILCALSGLVLVKHIGFFWETTTHNHKFFLGNHMQPQALFWETTPITFFS